MVKKKGSSAWRALGLMTNIGITLAVSVLIGYYIGYYLDQWIFHKTGYVLSLIHIFFGKYFASYFYGVTSEGFLDYEEIRKQALEIRHAVIVAGASAYPRIIDFKAFADICRECGAHLMVDMAHIAGLVAAELHPSPVPYADFVTRCV